MTAPTASTPAAGHRRRPIPSSRLRRGAFFLPSLFTVGNILLGFYAIVRGYRGDFPDAAVLIFIAAVLDTIDGRIARLMGTESDFGREYDSLADVLTFGAAPAVLSFFWGLEEMGRIGWLAPAFFLVCCATRLARFNVQGMAPPAAAPSSGGGGEDRRDFVGLPAPAAAGAIAALLFFAPDRDFRPWIAAVLTASLVGIGALMVSTFRYQSFKKIDLRRPRTYRAVLPLAAVLLVVAVHPPAVFLVAAGLYALSGPVAWLLFRRWRQREPAA